MVVRQTATTVQVTLITEESTSTSTLARISAPNGSVVLDYLYFNRPRVSAQSPMHHGSAILDIAGIPPYRMTGRYWTDRDTKGELRFEGRSSRFADDFADAKALFGDEDLNMGAG